jgi:hypothetical protein
MLSYSIPATNHMFIKLLRDVQIVLMGCANAVESPDTQIAARANMTLSKTHMLQRRCLGAMESLTASHKPGRAIAMWL